MRYGIFLSMLALLVGADPALAQIGTASGMPYPTDYPIQSTTKQRPVRQRAAPKAQATATGQVNQSSSNTLLPTDYPIQPAAKQRPARKRATSKSAQRQAATERVAKQTSPVPMPTAAPRAAAAAKPEPDNAKTEPAKSEPATTKTASAELPKSQPAKPAGDVAAFAGISAGDRLKIEQELYWSGDYPGAASGEDPIEAAIRSFQKRNKAKTTGTLTDEQRAELVAAADRHTREYGWRVVVDPTTGIRIGLPTKLMPNTHDAARGTRWSSPHGEVQVETFRIKNAKLSAVFDDEKKQRPRTIEHSTLSDDGFFISGMQGLKYFSVRAKQRDGEVRGFTLLYDQMMEGIVAPAVVAMASAFSPFPERPSPFAALTKKVEYGTGLIVGTDGHILTAGKVVQNCGVIVADGLGNAERVAIDGEEGLALLRVYGAGKLPALALSREAPRPGDVTLIGIPDPKEQDGAKTLTEIKAKLVGGNAIELRQPVPVAGFSGAAALDAQGRFVGVMETRNFVLASTDPGLPPVRLVTAAAIRGFLAQHHVAADGQQGNARAAAIRVICVRK
jgi:Trypsin-like peptidase domain